MKQKYELSELGIKYLDDLKRQLTCHLGVEPQVEIYRERVADVTSIADQMIFIEIRLGNYQFIHYVHDLELMAQNDASLMYVLRTIASKFLISFTKEAAKRA